MSDPRGTTDPYLAVDRATEGVDSAPDQAEDTGAAPQMANEAPAPSLGSRIVAYSQKEDYQHNKVILERFSRISPHAKRYVLSMLQDMI